MKLCKPHVVITGASGFLGGNFVARLLIDPVQFGRQPQLIAHAARTRGLCAGTIIGSGTVSNANYAEVGSSCIAERRAIEAIADGKPSTGFMRFGDTVRMEVRTRDGAPVFGVIEQKVVPA